MVPFYLHIKMGIAKDVPKREIILINAPMRSFSYTACMDSKIA